MPPDTWFNVVIGICGVTATIAVGGFAAWVGVKYGRQTRREDEYRVIGQIEGKLDGRSGVDLQRAAIPEGGIMMLLGELRSDVKNIRDDVTEIRNTQAIDRAAAKGEHADLRRELQAQITKLEDALRSVSATVRGINSHIQSERRKRRETK